MWLIRAYFYAILFFSLFCLCVCFIVFGLFSKWNIFTSFSLSFLFHPFLFFLLSIILFNSFSNTYKKDGFSKSVLKSDMARVRIRVPCSLGTNACVLCGSEAARGWWWGWLSRARAFCANLFGPTGIQSPYSAVNAVNAVCTVFSIPFRDPAMGLDGQCAEPSLWVVPVTCVFHPPCLAPRVPFYDTQSIFSTQKDSRVENNERFSVFPLPGMPSVPWFPFLIPGALQGHFCMTMLWWCWGTLCTRWSCRNPRNPHSLAVFGKSGSDSLNTNLQQEVLVSMMRDGN